MEQLAARAEQIPELEDTIWDERGAVRAYFGELDEARRLLRRAADVALQTHRLEAAAQHEAKAAVREALFGNASESRKIALAAHQLSSGRDSDYGAALALALAGESTMAQTLADDLEKRFPEDTSVRFNYLPTLRAVLALNHRQPVRAIDILQSAAPYELGQLCCSVGFTGSLYPIYVRGVAYLAARHGAEATREFQKVLDHRGIVATDPIGALARLQLGRALALAGDRMKAKAAYQDFLTLWKEADPSIPILLQARREANRP
jgi:hypothetical protein